MLESIMDNMSAMDELAITFSGALLYGMFLVSFVQCLRWQFFGEGRWPMLRELRKGTLALVMLIFSLTTIYTALSLVKSRRIVSNTLHGIPNDQNGMYPWYTIALCTVGNSTVLIVDTVVIYRCWLICGKRNKFLIFPIIMWIGGLVCTILQVYGETVPTGALGKGRWQPVNMEIGLGTVLAPFWGSTILLNTYTMCFIMCRIWKAARTTMGSGTAQIFLVAFYALAESGFLYFTTTLAHFIVWWTPSGFAIRMANAMNIPAIGIAFNVILIRAGQSRDKRLRTPPSDEKLFIYGDV